MKISSIAWLGGLLSINTKSVGSAVFSSSSISDRHVKPFLSAALFPEANFHIDTDASIANVADGLGALLGNEGRAYGSASGKCPRFSIFVSYDFVCSIWRLGDLDTSFGLYISHYLTPLRISFTNRSTIISLPSLRKPWNAHLPVRPHFLQKIQQLAGTAVGSVATKIQTLRLTKSSPRHVDCKMDGLDMVDTLNNNSNDGQVGFFVRNTNPNAFFDTDDGKRCIPIVEGTLIHFDGSLPPLSNLVMLT